MTQLTNLPGLIAGVEGAAEGPTAGDTTAGGGGLFIDGGGGLDGFGFFAFSSDVPLGAAGNFASITLGLGKDIAEESTVKLP